MVATTELRQLDTLLHQLVNSSDTNATDPQTLAEIEQLLAVIAAGEDGEDGDSMPIMPTMGGYASSPTGGGVRTASYRGGVAPSSYRTGQAEPASNAQSKATARYFMNHLQKDFHLTHDQAAGIVANLWHESGGMNPGMNQGGVVGSPSSDPNSGYGIAQWTGSRKQQFLQFAARRGLDPSSKEGNYAFLKHELETTQSGALDAVRSTGTATAATVAFCNTFERPGVPLMSRRLADLEQVLTA